MPTESSRDKGHLDRRLPSPPQGPNLTSVRGEVMSLRGVPFLALIAGGCVVAASALAGGGGASDADIRVRAAALAVYVHGMTAEIAEREIGPGGIGTLLR